MTAITIALAIAGVIVFVSMVLPVITFLRLSRHARRLDDLERKIEAIAAAVTARAVSAGASADAPAMATPPLTREAAADPALVLASPPAPLAGEPAALRADVPVAHAAATPHAFPAEAVPPAAVPPAAAATRLSLERRIGARWMLYVGIAALLFGTSYFIKFAIDNEWVGPGTRVMLGVMAGLGLVEGGRRLAARGVVFYGHVLSGGGLAIVYLSLYAAYTLYALVSASTAFALMLGNTGLAAALAARQRSQALALAAVIGGFATPVLASTGRDAQVTLFAYVALVIAATVLLARRGQWPWLNLASFVLTWLTVAAWAAAYYAPEKWLPTQVFLTLFAAMFLYILRETLRGLAPGPAGEGPALKNLTPGHALALVLAIGPALFHVASVANLARQPAALLVYLIAITALGIMAADAFRWRWTRLLVWAAVAAPFLAWIDAYPERSWFVPGLVGAVAVYGLHTLSQLRLLGRAGAPGVADILLLHGNGLWLYFAVAALVGPHALAWLDRVAWALAAWNLAVMAVARRAHLELALHYLALGATFVAIAVAVSFDGPWVTVGWAVEGTALVAIGLRARREWVRLAGGVLLAMAAVRLGADLLEPARAGALVLLNARAIGAVVVIVLLYVTAAAHRRLTARAGTHAAAIAALLLAANLLTLGLVSAEVTAAYRQQQWHAASETGAVPAGLELARETTLSAAWGAYGLVLVAVGIRRRYAPLRYLAIGILAVVIGKVFLVDLERLDRIYRVLSFIALGLVLLAASYLYQRFGTDPEEPGPAPTPPLA
jgi:uncharacterized membrane protein